MTASGVQYADLAGGHVLVAGGGSGIGLATVAALLEQGCRVAVFDRNPDAATALAEAEGASDRLLAVAGDVRDEEALRAWVSSAAAQFGPVTGCVASAGIEPANDDAVHALDSEVWDYVVDVNAGGMFRTLKVAMEALLREHGGGSVVLVGSPTGTYGMELGHHAYSASKGAVLGLGRVMANEYAARGIRVNVVWPGLVDTAINPFLRTDPDRVARETEWIPLRKVGQPEQIASMILFLLSEQASYCTGGIFVVDGGLTAV